MYICQHVLVCLHVYQHVFHVCLSREGDLVFSRPLTRTQVHTIHAEIDKTEKFCNRYALRSLDLCPGHVFA